MPSTEALSFSKAPGPRRSLVYLPAATPQPWHPAGGTLKISRLVAAVLTATSLLASTAYAQDAGAGDGQTIQATVTGYATGSDGGAVGSTTATGTATHWGTVAADWRRYPPGTRLQIEG